MAECEADRTHPERLRQQALKALVHEASREISPEFRKRLREYTSSPGLFSKSELVASARTGLEAETARNIDACPGLDVTNALCEALKRRGQRYAREQNSQLIAERHPFASIASESVRTAFEAVASSACTFDLK
jgi:hypothetical protein